MIFFSSTLIAAASTQTQNSAQTDGEVSYLYLKMFVFNETYFIVTTLLVFVIFVVWVLIKKHETDQDIFTNCRHLSGKKIIIPCIFLTIACSLILFIYCYLNTSVWEASFDGFMKRNACIASCCFILFILTSCIYSERSNKKNLVIVWLFLLIAFTINLFKLLFFTEI